MSSVEPIAGFAFSHAAGLIGSKEFSGEYSAKYSAPVFFSSIARSPCSLQRSISLLLSSPLVLVISINGLRLVRIVGISPILTASGETAQSSSMKTASAVKP